MSKSISRAALFAAAGLFVGGVAMPSAKAADLGGDCCADLEERVAELEATTARKGNRKLSLTVYGQVNRAMLYWNDGGRSNFYPGLDNHNSASRFGFMGDARISPSWKAGYSILLDWGDKARTSTVSQNDEDGSAKTNPQRASVKNDDGLARMRDVNWWIENKEVGRITMGRITNEGQNGLIDLAGTQPGVGSDPGCDGGGINFRRGDNGLLGTNMGVLTANCGGPFAMRFEGIKYTSPTWAGFIFAASVGEALKVQGVTIDQPNGVLTNVGRDMGVSLRYANEFAGGFRVAAGIGAEWSKFNEDDGNGGYTSIDKAVALGGLAAACGNPAGGNGCPATNISDYARYWAGALSLLHAPSGLFAQGHYTKLTVQAQNSLTADTLDPARDAHRWDIQAGIAKNFFGIGNSVLYGEYERHDNFNFALNANTYKCSTVAVLGAGCTALSAPTSLEGDKLKMWGVGFVQNIDAAAMEMYISWRHFTATDPNLPATADQKALDLVVVGSRIKF